MEPTNNDQVFQKKDKKRRQRPKGEKDLLNDDEQVDCLEPEELKTIFDTHFETSGLNKEVNGSLKKLMNSFFQILYYIEKKKIEKITEQIYQDLNIELKSQKDNIEKVNQEVLQQMFKLVDDSVTIQNKEYITNANKIIENADDMLSKIMYDKRIQNFSVDKDGQKIIHSAIKNNQQKIIDKLIENECDINVKDKNNDTPLHLAIANKNTQLANQLIDFGADVNAENLQKKTPIFMASEHQNKQIFQRLLDLVKDLNHRDDQQRTILLSLSCYFSNVDLLENVLEKGCDVNAVDKDGNNALMLLLIHDKSKDYDDGDDEDDDESSDEEESEESEDEGMEVED